MSLSLKQGHERETEITVTVIVSPDKMSDHLSEVAITSLDGCLITDTVPPLKKRLEHSILGKISGKTSMGEGSIPALALNELNKISLVQISLVLNRIFAGSEHIPTDWSIGRVPTLEKSSSKRGDLSTHRPITVSSVLHRIFMKILVARINEGI